MFKSSPPPHKLISWLMSAVLVLGVLNGIEIKAHAAQTWEFEYTGGIQSFTAPRTGQYVFEVWGAAGGAWYTQYGNARGGYSTGVATLNQGQTIYIVVGGKGKNAVPSSGEHFRGTGYNGGGIANEGGSHWTGGGATHIASKSGVLSSLSGNTSSVYIVAGGGGAASDWGSGGVGGGATGGNGVDSQGTQYSVGGTQTQGGLLGNKGSFGQGGNSTYGSGGAGGGGWYGGAGTHGVLGTSETTYGLSTCGGGGGSGYIGGVTNGSMLNGVRELDGFARITSVDTAPTTPSSIGFTLPTPKNYGVTYTVSWGSSTSESNTLAGYRLERQINGGTWTQIYQGTATSYSQTLTRDQATSVNYRVKAYSTGGLESGYRTGTQRSVVNNTAPTIPTWSTQPSTAVNQWSTATLIYTCNASTDADNDTITYYFERSINGGAYTSVQNGSSRTYSYTPVSGDTSVSVRVRAYDTRAYSGYLASNTTSVTWDTTAPSVSLSGTNG